MASHSLLPFTYRNSNKAQQELLLDLMWSIWPELPAYGRKAAQFVDLLGYFSLKTAQTEKKVKREVPTPTSHPRCVIFFLE